MPTHGILNLDKPSGCTSFDVVRAVRRLTGERRVGHGGTLDPLARGVLPVFLGQATRFQQFSPPARKVYQAEALLGVATDTYDADGEAQERREVPPFTLAELLTTCAAFVGRIEQRPPAYSAVKTGGARAYQLARAGKAPDLAPRLVEVVRIAIARWERPRLWLEVECGPGAYIRSLAHDLGQALGCGAHLTALVRTRSGPFTLAEAIALPQLEQEVAQDTWRRLLYPADHPLVDLPAAVLDEGSVHSMRHGQPVPLVAGPRSSPSCAGRTAGASKGLPCRAYGVEGAFLGVLAWQPDSGRLKPWKVLASAALAC